MHRSTKARASRTIRLAGSRHCFVPSTENLKTRVHLRDDGVRPYIELEPTNHPLAIAQRNGITVDRIAEIHARHVHGTD